MREIVAEADAPRGSLQHYFPAGKDELVGEALEWVGGVAARRVRRNLERMGAGPPSRLLGLVVEEWRRDLTAEGFVAGCPLVAAAADVVATSEGLREVILRAFDGWQEPLEEALLELGVEPGRAPALAMVVITALEGAIILARIRRDLVPLDTVVSELGPLLDQAVVPR
jgi:AcrR family transcriptional regulator